jgi:hypothetical protein
MSIEEAVLTDVFGRRERWGNRPLLLKLRFRWNFQ